MNLLTNKAKIDFETYIENLEVAPYVVMLDSIPKTYLNALKIDFFATVEIIITVEYDKNTNQYFGSVLDLSNGIRVDVSNNIKSLHKYYESAIDKANEIYNNH